MGEAGPGTPIDFEDWVPEHKLTDADPVEPRRRQYFLRRIMPETLETKPVEPPESK